MPPNCKFELDNAQLEWTYAPNRFDFVHLRCLFGSIKDWPALYREVYKYDCLSFTAPFFQIGFLSVTPFHYHQPLRSNMVSIDHALLSVTEKPERVIDTK